VGRQAPGTRQSACPAEFDQGPTILPTTSSRRNARALGLFAWLLLAALLLWSAAAAAAHKGPQAVAGRLALPGGLQRPLPLAGEWGFAWHRFVDPGWTTLPTTALAPVPQAWNALTADGKPRGENGWGSYVLQVDCPAGRSLSLEAVAQRTATRIYVNGELVGAAGTPGPSREASWPAVFSRIPISRAFACPLRITVHVSNFDHRAGGFVRPANLGPADVLERHREVTVAYDAALLTAYLLTGALALIFFLASPRERTALAYGLFCVAMAIYTDMIGARLLLRPWPAQVSWIGYMRVEYLSWIAAMGLFLATLRGLFPQEIDRRLAGGILGVLAVAGASVFVLGPGTYSQLALPGQAIALVVALYVAAAMLRARRRERADAGALLVGMLAILVTQVLDLLLIDAPGPDRKFAPIGFALFLLSPAVVIARRMTAAVHAQERSRALEENARLREDVERMARHDLKTPLNSILGAARLLADDRRLQPDQLELVEVLRRAGLRMQEMVNLSLGLYRMETGTYALQPQAVDLGELVSRVLVDLHPYAEAAGVTLRWHGSDAAPVVVRGEEILCYSIVANLVKNAVEATAAGGAVTIRLRGGNPVQLAVHNPGEVPTAIAQRFFEKYVTGKSGGTGLGTYSARLMARAQHGDLTLRTGAAEGTVLTLTLPATRGELPRPLPAAGAEPARPDWLQALPARTVLLVDDDEFTRLVHRRLLPEPPFIIETAANGQAAVGAMERRWPDYLLVDMEMPVMNGIETLHWLRDTQRARGLPHCRAIMVSGRDDEAAADQALAAGADRFLAKPVSREALLQAIRELEQQVPAASAPAAAAGPHEADAQEEAVAVDAELLAAFPGFLQQQADAVVRMRNALEAGDRDDLQFLAHRAFGALSAMGVSRGATEARALERRALEAEPAELVEHLDRLAGQLARVRFVPR
jgi:signal transduction histidine kinase/DNA-binding response OmpR family regulator